MKPLLSLALLVLSIGCAPAAGGGAPPPGSHRESLIVNNTSRDRAILYADGFRLGQVFSGSRERFTIPRGARLALRFEASREMIPLRREAPEPCWYIALSDVRFLNEVRLTPCT